MELYFLFCILLTRKLLNICIDYLNLVYHGGNSDAHPKWTDSKRNWRVATSEHAGRAPPTVDVKTLRKQWDPEEDGNVLHVREQEKSTSVALVSRGGRSSGLSDSFNGVGDLVDLQSSTSSVNVGKKRSPKKKKRKKKY